MQINDWFNAALNIVIGVFLGIAIAGLGQLAATDFWPVAVVTVVLIAGLFLFDGLIDRLFNKVFPTGIRPARKPQKRRSPLPRRLSLPLGMVLGVVLVWLDLGDNLLGLIS